MKAIKSVNLDVCHVEAAICDAVNHKMHKPEFLELFSEFSTDPMYPEYYLTPSEIEEAWYGDNANIINDCIRRMAISFYNEIKNRTVTFPPHDIWKRIEPTNGKEREIDVQSPKQLIFDYIVCNALSDKLFNMLGMYQGASVPGRGISYTKEAIEEWVHNQGNKDIWYIKTDVRNYFHSIDQEKLYKMFAKHVYDEDILYIIKCLLSTYKEGVSIGSYFSQHAANFFLSDVYHKIESSCIRERHGVRYNNVKFMMIYMDDILIFGYNKSAITSIYKKLAKLIKDKGLELHHTHIGNMQYGDYIDVIGYRIYRDHTEIRNRNLVRIINLVNKCNKHRMTLSDARTLMAYKGIILSSDCVRLRYLYNLDMLMNRASVIIANHDRRLVQTIWAYKPKPIPKV